MTETAMQTANCGEGTLEWNTDQRTCLTFPAGRQRARLLLAADLLAGFADGAVEDTARGLTAAFEGWERGRKQLAPDLAAGERASDAADRERDKLRRELELLKAFDLDRYLYEVAKAALLEQAEFGQLTTLLKKFIEERKGRAQSEVMVSNWRTPEAWIAVQVSPRDGDLLEAVHATRTSVPFPRERFVGERILPAAWFLEWILSNQALSLELGRSEVQVIKALAPLEKDMPHSFRTLHRQVVRTACGLRGFIEAVELIPGPRNGPLRLRLRSDYIAHFLPAFADHRSLSERFDRAWEMDLAGLVVVGMSASGKTTFLRRCYDLLREHPDNRLNEEIDPHSTAFVVGHMFRDVQVPLFDGRKRITLCWMDTAGSENYRLLGQQMTVSVRELKRMFHERPAGYNLLFMWSYETGYDPARDAPGFEDVLSRFIDEIENLAYFDLEPPRRTYLLLNKADAAGPEAAQFASEHERRFRSVLERKGMAGEPLGFVSALDSSGKDISDRFQVAVFGLSDRDWKDAFTAVRAGINQGVIGNLLDPEEAQRFKRQVYDHNAGGGQEKYLQETSAWIDRFLDQSNGSVTTRALLRSLRAFLAGEMEGDAVA